MRRFAYLLVVLLAACGLTLGTSAFAGASVASPKVTPDALVASHYSQYLAGHAGEGNGSQTFNDVRAQLSAPPENAAVPADAIADGMLLAQNVSAGGLEVGAALVFDTSSCPGDQWTVEYGDGTYSFTGPVIDISSLSPAEYFGNPVCVGAGQSVWLEIYQARTSLRHVEIIEGSARTDDNAVASMTLPFRARFGTFGLGVNTTSGPDAATLTLGTLADFASSAVTTVRDDYKVNGRQQTVNAKNYDDFTGTVTGGSPSVANPVTLTPSGVGPIGSFTVTVP